MALPVTVHPLEAAATDALCAAVQPLFGILTRPDFFRDMCAFLCPPVNTKVVLCEMLQEPAFNFRAAYIQQDVSVRGVFCVRFFFAGKGLVAFYVPRTIGLPELRTLVRAVSTHLRRARRPQLLTGTVGTRRGLRSASGSRRHASTAAGLPPL